MNNRTEKLRISRNLNEVMDIVTEIDKSSAKTARILSNINKVHSISADEGSIKIGHTAQKIMIGPVKLNKKDQAQTKTAAGIVQDLYESSQNLDAALAMIINKFDGQKGQPAAIAAIKTLKTNVDKTIKDAQASMKDIAAKHQPEASTRMTKNLVAFLKAKLDSSLYSAISEKTLVNIEDDNIQFCNYINIKDLADDSGFTTQDYYIIFTYVVPNGEGELKQYVTSVHEFRPPGRYDLTGQFKDTDKAKTEIRNLMAHDSIYAFDNQATINMDDHHVKSLKLIPGVKKVSIDGDTLTVMTEKGIKIPVRNSIISTVASLIRATGEKNIPRQKILSDRIEFILVPGPKTKHTSIPLNKLLLLKDKLDLTDEQVKAFKQALKST